MRAWLNKYWWGPLIVLAIACVIGWKEKSCHTQAYQCRAQYAAQLESVVPNEQASEDEAIAAACEPDSYLCRLVSAANLPTLLLVIIGALGIVAAIRTLGAIEKQADIMEKQYNASSKEIILLNRAYLTVDSWMLDNLAGQGYLGEMRVSFRIRNPSNTAARIERVDFQADGLKLAGIRGRMLTPGETHWENFPIKDAKEGQVIQIRGSIFYRDLFRIERHRKFAQNLLCRAGGSVFQEAEGSGLNDEEGWDKD